MNKVLSEQNQTKKSQTEKIGIQLKHDLGDNQNQPYKTEIEILSPHHTTTFSFHHNLQNKPMQLSKLSSVYIGYWDRMWVELSLVA